MAALTAGRDNQYLMIDSAIVRATSRPQAEKGAKDQALGRSQDGLTTKIHMLADALGRPLRFIVTAGRVGDITQAPALLDGQCGDAVLTDKAYGSNALRAIIAAIGATAVIPSNRTLRIIIPRDAFAYKQRNRIESCFYRLKHFRQLRCPL
ncbi:transposase [Bradyrhizobium yuanmingense]|uniref:Transposase n=1 Tax=Bradyrhizobium yuanmingense TaxID=108015 RepID=A0ABV4G7D5_9BRAD